MFKLEFEYNLNEKNIFEKEDKEKFEHEEQSLDVRNDGCVTFIKTFFHRKNNKSEC